VSARDVTTPPHGARASGALPALPIIAGIGALLLRLFILQTPDTTRTLLLALVYGAILTASIAVPIGRETTDGSRLHPVIVLALGLAGVAIAATAGGRPVAASFGADAVALSVFAAVAEEALFRRAAYGWLSSRSGATVAIVGSALLFALIHVPLYGPAAFPVDLGAGLLLSWQRWASGTWTVPAATHAAANLLAVVLR
jgi:membrane protease YdiL (CAAX protease family)